MVFTINLGRREQEKLRELVLSEISLRIEAKDFMNELPNVINKEKWNDVIDFSIASGNTKLQHIRENNLYVDTFSLYISSAFT